MAEPLMTIKEVAKYLKMDEKYLYSLVARKAIPHYRVSSRTIRFRRSDIDEWMKKISLKNTTEGDVSAAEASDA